MHKFILFIKEFKFPKKSEIKKAILSFSTKEFWIFFVGTVVAIISLIILLAKLNNAFMVEVPSSGGSISEGIIGMPTLVNPVLALSDADKDVTALVYSGLMRKSSDGSFIEDIAESYTVSEDGMIYTFIIKDNVKFHDGEKITADDILFTIEKIKDPFIKSPRRISWEGISVSKQDERTIIFTLKKPFISFMDNTTVGILPAHIWKNVTPQEFALSPLNIKATGSGPYKIISVDKNTDGVPIRYSLKYFNDFSIEKPHIKNIDIISYSNEKDLIKGLLSHSINQASGISPENAQILVKEGYKINTATLPRIFGMFFNKSKNKIFEDSSVLNAIKMTLNKQEIVDNVLYGYGKVIDNPIPNSIIKTEEDNSYDINKANEVLNKAGWKIGEDGVRYRGGVKEVEKIKTVKGKKTKQIVKVDDGPIVRLTFSITTGDAPELVRAVSIIKDQLATIGIEVDNSKIYETGQLNQLIRNRDYEALFFGQIVSHESDIYSFWHSSQKNDPGLNIAMYNNKKADTILESIQKILNKDTRIKKYYEFLNEFDKDIPAFLIYSPSYLYATSQKLNNISLDTITIPSDRFSQIYKWYADTDHIWKIFKK